MEAAIKTNESGVTVNHPEAIKPEGRVSKEISVISAERITQENARKGKESVIIVDNKGIFLLIALIKIREEDALFVGQQTT